MKLLSEHRTAFRQFNDNERRALEISTDTTQARRTVFLIDEATNTYKEARFWDERLKNSDFHSHTSDLFILVCVYGSVDGKIEYGPDDWQSSKIPTYRRIEFFLTVNGL